MIGLYSGIVLNIGMSVSGLLGVIILLFLFWLTLMIIRWWHDLGTRVNIFPRTLTWVYALTNMSRYRQMRENEKRRAQNQAEFGDRATLPSMSEEDEEALNSGYTANDLYDRKSLNGFGAGFTEDGRVRSDVMSNPNNLDMFISGYYQAYLMGYKDNPNLNCGDCVHNWRNSRLKQLVYNAENNSNIPKDRLSQARVNAWNKINGNYNRNKKSEEKQRKIGQEEDADDED